MCRRAIPKMKKINTITLHIAPSPGHKKNHLDDSDVFIQALQTVTKLNIKTYFHKVFISVPGGKKMMASL